jgi:hypothetical protein
VVKGYADGAYSLDGPIAGRQVIHR